MDLKQFEEGACRNASALRGKFHFSEEEERLIDDVCQTYPMLINDYYLSLIDPDDPKDPIRKMAIPSADELQQNGQTDTSGEKDNTVLPGVQHKYAQTILILSTQHCFMYCRHCFRKRMVGLTDNEINTQLNALPAYIREHPAVNNVLISGGDAFGNSNKQIERYLKLFTEMEQLDLIRFGTRTPAAFPQRITQDPELVRILKEYSRKKQIYVVTQFNHPREVTPEAIEAVSLLKDAGIIVKNQTVLLKGINDAPEMIGELLSSLTRIGVVPYYIFQCRPVRGVMNHFQVPIKRGLEIVDGAKAMQNGQGKCVRYAMSLPTGKVEILGPLSDKDFLFKYYQAKDPADSNRIFTQEITDDQCWLDEIRR